MTAVKLHIATSRHEQIGDRCISWAKANGHKLTNMKDCDVFVSVLYDQLLSKEYIDSRSCYNFHPGILPYYRGAGVYSWVLLNKAKETGVTLHKIDYNIDSGPIVATSTTLIGQYDTAESLFVRCMDLLFTLFTEHLGSIVLGKCKTYPNIGGRLYTRKDLDEVKDITHIIKALTFTGKESAYWIDPHGEKHEVPWQ